MTIVYRPGMQIQANGPSVEETATGTLGCFARAKGTSRGDGLADDTPVLLTCSHVMFPRFVALAGVGVYQPSYSSCCSGGELIATPAIDPTVTDPEGQGRYMGGFETSVANVRHSSGAVDKNGEASRTDCAIASVLPAIQFQNQWRHMVDGEERIIPITGAVSDGLWLVPGPDLGMAPTGAQYVRVMKRSGELVFATLMFRRTAADYTGPDHVDLPDGTRARMLYPEGLSGTSPEDDAAAGAIPNFEQYILMPRPTPVPGENWQETYRKSPSVGFEDGDSGTVVINGEGKVIAQLVRVIPLSLLGSIDTSALEWSVITGLGVASPIKNVLQLLSLEIPEMPLGFTNIPTAPMAGTAIELDPGLAERETLRALVTRLRIDLQTSRRGRWFVGKIVQHRDEVRRLFARVRAIAAGWRELGGAAFYHHCVTSLRDPEHVIPSSINDVSRERVVELLLPVVLAHASPALRRDIERHLEWARETLLPIARLGELPDRMGARR